MAAPRSTRVLWFATAVAAGVGGLLGGRFWTLGRLSLLLVVAVGGAVGVLVALRWTARGPRPSPVVPQRAAEQPQAVERSGPAQAAPWWQRDSPPAPAVREAPRRQEFDATRAHVAQCPRCGGFELDVHRADRGYAFRCRAPNCGTAWQWAVGAAWPAVVVRRNLGGPPPG
ncbi:hypothetical protein [Umezawaea sp.]|uniref:hypothetical protein n=1 Tax=Umezawaea sp. TaxID=1955258 RepID=UPI002ED0E7FF